MMWGTGLARPLQDAQIGGNGRDVVDLDAGTWNATFLENSRPVVVEFFASWSVDAMQLLQSDAWGTATHSHIVTIPATSSLPAWTLRLIFPAYRWCAIGHSVPTAATAIVSPVRCPHCSTVPCHHPFNYQVPPLPPHCPSAPISSSARCPHCRHFAPAYAKLGTAMTGRVGSAKLYVNGSSSGGSGSSSGSGGGGGGSSSSRSEGESGPGASGKVLVARLDCAKEVGNQ